MTTKIVEYEENVEGKTDDDSIQSEAKGKTILRFRMKDIFSSQKVHPLASSTSSFNSCQYNASSRRHRLWLTAKILGVSALAIIGLFVFVILEVDKAIDSMEEDRKVKGNVDHSIKVADLIHALQVERGLTVLSISSKQNTEIKNKLESARQNTTTAMENVRSWPEQQDQSKEAFKNEVRSHRISIGDGGENSTIKHEIEFYTNITERSLLWLFQSFKKDISENVVFDLLGYQMFLAAKDKTGIERALGGSFFSSGHFNNSDLLWYAEQRIIGDSFLSTSMKLMPILETLFEEAIDKTENIIDQVNSERSTILKNNPRQGNSSAGDYWFTLMSKYISALLTVQKAAGDELVKKLDKRVSEQKTSLYFRAAVLVLVFILTPLLVLAVTRMTNTIQKYAAKLEDITFNLKGEQKRTDDLLSAMFPQSVAETLKRGEKVNSEYFDSVTVFFSDIVNFTNICACISPIEVTSMLNSIYSAFDDKIDKYDVYKVETIGDAYMVASGLPERNGNKHVDEISRMALDLVKMTESFELTEVPGETLLIRVGIHTGPCVSGIVGNKMPRYCLFGDTVNTASRMQTTGDPQKIHISEGTYKALRPFKQYVLEFRGYVQVKGKGEMETYWLHGFESFESFLTSHETASRKSSKLK